MSLGNTVGQKEGKTVYMTTLGTKKKVFFLSTQFLSIKKLALDLIYTQILMQHWRISKNTVIYALS